MKIRLAFATSYFLRDFKFTMQKKTSFLDFHAKKGTGFLHPGGISMTNVLLKEIDLEPELNILEIGCGTGATVVKLAKHNHCKLTAIDQSEKMLKAARQRAWFNKVTAKIKFIQITNQSKLPFEDDTFDVIYAESVLAIIEPNQLGFLMDEISRVLKPNAKFISNDAIWKDTTDIKMIEQINSMCLRDFGIVQSTSTPAHKKEWIHLFEEGKLEVIKIIAKDDVKSTHPKTPKKDLFWFYKTMRCLLNPFFIAQKLTFDKALRTSHIDDGKFLSSYLFVLINKKAENSKITKAIL